MAAKQQTRRKFLQAGAIGAAASLAVSTGCGAQIRSISAPPAGKIRFKLGLASYTLRKFKLDETLEMTKRVGLKYICFKSFHLPLDSTPRQIADVVKKVKDAGLILYGGGVISMKTKDQVNSAFEYAKAAGMKVIVGMPVHGLLGVVNKKVEEYDIKVAIHNHGPGDKYYPTPARIYEIVKGLGLDKRIGICMDIGHTKRAGVDPSVSAEKFADRLLDVHIKDVTGPTANDHGCEIGRGVIDIPKFLRTLVKIKYAGVVSFEYEKDADDPLAGLAESVGYVKGALAAISRPPAAKDVFLAP